MTYHTIAWSEPISPAGTFQAIAAVADDQVFTDGDDFRVPAGLDVMLAAWAVGLATTRARISSPSLRAFINQELAPKIVSETVPADVPIRLNSYMRSPLQLAVGEFINFESDGGAGAPTDISCVAFLSDGPVTVREGPSRTARATAAIAGVQREWTTGNFVFSEDLPAGRYQVIGGRCETDAPGAWRLIFREGGPRPGSLSTPDNEGADVMGSRMGMWGVWGEFDINQPPTLEILSFGGVASAQVLYLDLMQVGG